MQVFAQVFITDEQFNGGVTPAANWVYSGTISSSSGSGNFGRNAPNITLGTPNGLITYSWTGAANDPDLITFVYRGQGASANCAATTILVEESTNGSTWSTVAGTNIQLQSSFTSSFKGTLNSSTRFVRITASPPASTSCYIDDFKIRKAGNCTSDPIIKLILIDGGCTAGCEGGNEFVVAQNGNSSLAIDDLQLEIQSPGGVSPKGTTIGGNATNSTAFWTKNATYTAAQLSYISALTGTCSAGTFIPVSSTDIIPANANMLLITGSAPTHTYNFNTACSTGPYYVVFSNLDCTGKFSNSGCTQCFRTISLMNNGTGCVDTKTYTSVSSAAAGVSIAFNSVTSSPSQILTSCNNFVILPIDLLDFYVTKNGSGNEMIWKVAQEENILYYTIEKSKDAINFTELATVYSNNSIDTKSYSVFDSEPYHDITYYRLSTKETDGTTKNYKIISLDEKENKWEYIHYQTENNLVLEFKKSLPKNSVVSLYDISGKELITQPIKQSQTMLDTEILESGVYFVSLSTPFKTEHFKIIISK
jgi:hypothetical protein